MAEAVTIEANFHATALESVLGPFGAKWSLVWSTLEDVVAPRFAGPANKAPGEAA